MEVIELAIPMHSLDPIGIHEIRNYLLELSRNEGVTIIISSHTVTLLLEKHHNIKRYLIYSNNIMKIYESIGIQGENNRTTVENKLLIIGFSLYQQKLEDYFSELIGGGGIG